MYRIMFVCHGNICRSPMAEYVMKDIIKKQGREKDFFISSSAVSEEEIWNGKGNPVYPPVKKLLLERGISCEEKRATLLTKQDGEKYDLFLCMDDSNLRGARYILGGEYNEKIKKLLHFAGENGNVADPWYTRDFDAAYQDILRGIEGLFNSL